MARARSARKSNSKPMRGRRKSVLPALLIALLLAVGGLLGYMHLSARVVHLNKAELYLQDLPAAFDGTKLIFLSDVNIRNEKDSAAARRTLQRLQQLSADLLILGGDYSAPTLLESLNGASGGNTEKAQEFIAELTSFPAKLGKFAVCGENDDPAALEGLFSASGVQLLQDGCAEIKKDGGSLVIAGLSGSGSQTHYEQIGNYFSGDECVIAVTHNPAGYVGVRVAEARGGGAWADAVLAGHTLGGQINILGRNLRNLPEAEERCIGGWYYSDDLPMLVSQGLGCKGAMLRLGSRSEIWLITLRRPSSAPQNQKFLPDF